MDQAVVPMAADQAVVADAAADQAVVAQSPGEDTVAADEPAPSEAREPVRERVRARAGAASASPSPSASALRTVRPVVTVRTDGPAVRPLRVVERALRAPGNQADVRREQVVIVPGGHRPGRPDPVQRDQARARLPLPGPARIVVLGCTAGAGQTLTTLLTGQLLASLRGEAVAVLDLRPGPSSLTERARAIPRLLPSLRPAPDAGDIPAPDSGGNGACRW